MTNTQIANSIFLQEGLKNLTEGILTIELRLETDLDIYDIEVKVYVEHYEIAFIPKLTKGIKIYLNCEPTDYLCIKIIDAIKEFESELIV